jgi:hypothetical protein
VHRQKRGAQHEAPNVEYSLGVCINMEGDQSSNYGWLDFRHRFRSVGSSRILENLG